MKHPRTRFLGSSRPPASEKRGTGRQVFSLDEQFGERRMRDVVLLPAQRHLDVTRHLNLSGTIRGIRERHTADLGVVL